MPSAWNNFVQKFYNEKHAADSNYKFKQALTDAAPIWKSKNKGAGAAPGPAVAAGVKKATRRSRKSKRASKSKKSSKSRRSSGRKTRKH